MNIEEAKCIVADSRGNNNFTADEEFMYIEALEFLIKETSNSNYMMELGGYYYGRRDFDLALKYYEMAAAVGHEYANECLGYIWYYGRTGEKDYEKAFGYFSEAAKTGNLVARYKVADMYKNGYYVEKDYEKYKEIIRELHAEVAVTCRTYDDPVPEIYTRLAAIEAEEGKPDEAITLYLEAKAFLARRISYNPFFGNMNIMKWLIEDLYKIIDPDPEDMDFFDLYYWLTIPCRICFTADGKRHEVSCVKEDDGLAVNFEGKWFRDVDDFFKKAHINGRLLTDMYKNLNDFVLEEKTC